MKAEGGLNGKYMHTFWQIREGDPEHSGSLGHKISRGYASEMVE